MKSARLTLLRMRGEFMTSDIMKFILSGGGVALLAAFGKLAYDWIQGRVMREESAVTQWQGIARSRLEEIHRKDAELNAYKAAYSALWRAYVVLPPLDKQDFPVVPKWARTDNEEE